MLETFYETFKSYYFILYIRIFGLHVCHVFTTCVLGACGAPTRLPDSLELQEKISHDMGAENQTPVPLEE